MQMESLVQQLSLHLEQVVDRRISEAEERLEQKISRLLGEHQGQLLGGLKEQHTITLSLAQLLETVAQKSIQIKTQPKPSPGDLSVDYSEQREKELLPIGELPLSKPPVVTVAPSEQDIMSGSNDAERKADPVETSDRFKDSAQMTDCTFDYTALSTYLQNARDHKHTLERFEVSEATRGQVARLFSELDIDQDGFLSNQELTEGIAKTKDPQWKPLKKIFEHALQHADKNEDGLLDIDEFTELFMVDQPNFYTRHHRKIQYFLALLYFVLAPCVYIPLNPSEDGDHWSAWDALYFAAVTVTTVGYGDYGPNNDQMRIFTVFYILFGLTIVASVVNDIVQGIVHKYDEKMKQLNAMVMDGMKDTAKQAAESLGVDDDTSQKFDAVFKTSGASKIMTKIKEKVNMDIVKHLWFSLLLFATPVLVGTVFFAINEDWSYIHSFYWSVVTCTTVGYGDMALEKQSSRAFSFFYILFGFGFVAAAIANVGDIHMQHMVAKKKCDFMKNALTSDFMHALQIDHDGRKGVDHCEFLCAMLLLLGKCSEEDLLLVLAKFDELDVDKNGQITKEDQKALRKAQKKMKKGKARQESKEST